MSKCYWLLLCCLVLSLAACSPTSSKSPAIESEGIAQNTDTQGDESGDKGQVEHSDERREYGAHVHGVANLSIAWSGSELVIDLNTPAYNVLGFEYAPLTIQQEVLLEESIAAFQTGDLLVLSPDAGCEMSLIHVETDIEDDNRLDGATHSDFEVMHNIECQNPSALESVDAGPLFSRFPNFETVQVQWVSDTTQSAKELTQNDTIVDLNQ